MCRIVLCSVVFVGLLVLDISSGKHCVRSIISSSYERLSVESGVLDAPQRRRHRCCCTVMAASSYCTERRIVLGLKVRIVGRCYIYAVAAELCGCSWCMLLQSCAACWAFLLGEDVPQYESEMPRSLPNNILMRRASAKREPFFFLIFQGKKEKKD